MDTNDTIEKKVETELYINSSVVISNYEVVKDGQTVLRSANSTISEWLNEIHNFTGVKYQRFYKMDNLSRLGWLAAEILLDNRFQSIGYSPADVGIILSNANSSLDTDIRYHDSMENIPSPALFVYTLPNIVIGEIAIRHKIKGENAFFIFERFNAAFIEQYVSGLLNNNILQACVCGWVDVLGDNYKTVLFLVEKTGRGGSRPFNAGIMNQIFQ